VSASWKKESVGTPEGLGEDQSIERGRALAQIQKKKKNIRSKIKFYRETIDDPGDAALQCNSITRKRKRLAYLRKGAQQFPKKKKVLKDTKSIVF